MKIILLLALAGLCAAYPSPQRLEEEVLIEEEPRAPYTFGYEVRDDDTTNYQNRAEAVDEDGVLKGSYSYVLSDNHVYTVTYIDRGDGTGIDMKVSRTPTDVEVVIPPRYEEKRARKASTTSQ